MAPADSSGGQSWPARSSKHERDRETLDLNPGRIDAGLQENLRRILVRDEPAAAGRFPPERVDADRVGDHHEMRRSEPALGSEPLEEDRVQGKGAADRFGTLGFDELGEEPVEGAHHRDPRRQGLAPVDPLVEPAPEPGRPVDRREVRPAGERVQPWGGEGEGVDHPGRTGPGASSRPRSGPWRPRCGPRRAGGQDEDAGAGPVQLGGGAAGHDFGVRPWGRWAGDPSLTTRARSSANRSTTDSQEWGSTAARAARPEPGPQSRVGRQPDSRRHKVVRLVDRGGEPVLAVPDKLPGGGVVESGDGEPARHGLGQDIAESLRQAGVDVDVGRGVVAADLVAGKNPAKTHSGCSRLSLASSGPSPARTNRHRGLASRMAEKTRKRSG